MIENDLQIQTEKINRLRKLNEISAEAYGKQVAVVYQGLIDRTAPGHHISRMNFGLVHQEHEDVKAILNLEIKPKQKGVL